MKKYDLQELAELIRDIAYSDEQSHGIDWSLSIIHPRTNDGDIGYSGGIWHRFNDSSKGGHISIHFSFSESRGIHGFKFWRDGSEVRFGFKDKPTYEQLKELCIKEFSIKHLYREKIS